MAKTNPDEAVDLGPLDEVPDPPAPPKEATEDPRAADEDEGGVEFLLNVNIFGGQAQTTKHLDPNDDEVKAVEAKGLITRV